MADWLVTGGAGFIGSHLVDALVRREDRVRVLDDLSSGRRANLPASVELMVGDVTDPVAVARAVDGVCGVFHLAAIASVNRATEQWAATHAVNQTGTITVLEAVRRAGSCGSTGNMPVVYASSAAIYGKTDEGPVAEEQPASPCSAYGCDKLGSELHAGIASRLFGIPTAGLRFFNVYGPRQNGASPYSGVISVFRETLARGGSLMLNGTGEQTRDFVFVADVATTLVAVMDQLAAAPAVVGMPPCIFNVCTGHATSIRQLAGLMGDLSGIKSPPQFGPGRVGDILHSRGDPRRLATALGVRCDTPLRAGLSRIVAASPAANYEEARSMGRNTR